MELIFNSFFIYGKIKFLFCDFVSSYSWSPATANGAETGKGPAAMQRDS